jgi:hypothetical protein
MAFLGPESFPRRHPLMSMLIVSATLFVIAVLWAESLPPQRAHCASIGGKWVSTGIPHCETDSCFDDHSCLPSYSNSAICRRLRLRITERELVFQLGEPVRRDGRTLFFTPSPTACDDIRAELDAAGLLGTIDCGHPRPRCDEGVLAPDGSHRSPDAG